MDLGPFKVTVFSGLAGRIVRRSASIESVLVGFVLVGSLSLAAWWFHQLRADSAASAIVHLGISLALARFALEGRAFDERSLFFSGAWWGETVAVTLRYIVLSLVWLLPLVLIAIQGRMMPDGSWEPALLLLDPRLQSLLTVYVAAQILSPPILLIIAAGADGWSDLIRPARWQAMFRGRGADLFLIYAVYIGSLAMVILLTAPVVLPLVRHSLDAVLFFGFVVMVFAAGFSVSMLGRLCGAYAGFPDEAAHPAPARAPDAAPTASRPMPRRAPAPGPAPAPSPSASSARPAPDSTAPASHRVPEAAPVPPHREAAAATARPPLLAAREKVAEICGRADHNLGQAIGGLRALREKHAPNPLVLHALVELLLRDNRIEEAREILAEAMPLFFERGNLRLAAETYRRALQAGIALQLKPDQYGPVAGEFLRAGDAAAALPAFERAIEASPWDRAAVKGLIQIADGFLRDSRPEEARAVFAWLLEHCPDSPFADSMQHGLHESERRIAAATRRSA